MRCASMTHRAWQQMSMAPEARRPGERLASTSIVFQSTGLRNRRSHLDQRYLRHRATRRRWAAITPRSRRLVAAVRARPAFRPRAYRDFLRLRRDWPFRELKAELALARFLLDQHDPN